MSENDQTNNLEIWNKVSQPPDWALKEITGGRLKGKTDINPQWRYNALTEHFGICGIGWKYEIVRLWEVAISNVVDDVFAFSEIKLYIKQDGQWSDPIPGIGGSLLVETELKGLHANDEAFKMATTDALSVACKMLGIGANIYSGSKYDTKNKTVIPPKKTTKTDQEIEKEISGMIESSQTVKQLTNRGISMKELKKEIKDMSIAKKLSDNFTRRMTELMEIEKTKGASNGTLV